MSEASGNKQYWIRIALPIVLVAGLIGVMAGVIFNQGDDGDGVTELVLEPIASVGNDPFTPSIVPGAVGNDVDLTIGDDVELVSMVVEQLNPPIGELPGIDFSGIELPESDEGTVNVSAAAPGLYGGTNIIDVCDRTQLANFLLADEAKGEAWANVHDIDVSEIPAFIASLTDVILQTDTRVTNHGFRDGEAYPIDSVLQAGTAVMVDTNGVPRVRCYCGNPLTEARQLGTEAPELVGEEWEDFDIDDAVVITGTGVVDELVLDDMTSTNFVIREPGSELEEAQVVNASGEAIIEAEEPTPIPEEDPTPEPTVEPTPAPTSTPEPTPRPEPTNITTTGSVSASSIFSADFATGLAVDGSTATSWFSAGGGSSTYTWTGPRSFIDSIDIISNANHQVVDFRTGFGFEGVTVIVLDGGEAVYSESFGLGGTPDPDVFATPGVEGDTIVLEFSGGEDPTCGGFSELVIRGSPA